MKERSLCGPLPLVVSFICLLGLVACESSDTGDQSGQVGDTTGTDTLSGTGDAPLGDTQAVAGSGKVLMSFSATNGVKKSPNLTDPLTGTVYGALWKSEDVAVLGPVDGAEDVGGVEVANVDTTEEGPSTTTWTSEPLPAGEYIFLGFFDVDGNGAESKSPDPGDPVTLPFTNKFVVEDNQTTPLEVVFELVYN